VQVKLRSSTVDLLAAEFAAAVAAGDMDAADGWAAAAMHMARREADRPSGQGRWTDAIADRHC